MSIEIEGRPDMKPNAYIGLCDSADGKTMEVCGIVDPDVSHPESAPHMIVLRFLESRWEQILAAAQLEHVLASSAAVKSRIVEAGGLHPAASA